MKREGGKEIGERRGMGSGDGGVVEREEGVKKKMEKVKKIGELR